MLQWLSFYEDCFCNVKKYPNKKCCRSRFSWCIINDRSVNWSNVHFLITRCTSYRQFFQPTQIEVRKYFERPSNDVGNNYWNRPGWWVDAILAIFRNFLAEPNYVQHRRVIGNRYGKSGYRIRVESQRVFRQYESPSYVAFPAIILFENIFSYLYGISDVHYENYTYLRKRAVAFHPFRQYGVKCCLAFSLHREIWI